MVGEDWCCLRVHPMRTAQVLCICVRKFGQAQMTIQHRIRKMLPSSRGVPQRNSLRTRKGDQHASALSPQMVVPGARARCIPILVTAMTER